jgi:hypothetical protein
MSMDRRLIEDFLDRICDKFTAAELIEILEDAGIITIYDIVGLLEEECIEYRDKLEV